jgi:heat shock protein HtpX
VLSWLLIGTPFPFTVAIECLLIILLVSVLRHRFYHKTIALIGMMGLMVIQGIVIVFAMHFEPWRSIPHANFDLPAAYMLQLLFRLNLPLAELGIGAAICIGFYIEFGRSRLNLSQTFPNLAFCEPTNELVQTVKRLSESAKIECPDLSLVDSGAPSAFTVRTRGKYTVAISVGLLESFETSEVEACIAHEICHIKNRDFALRTIITVVRVAVFTRVLSYFIETAFYRTRELLADKTAVTLTGGPGPLISALRKLQSMDVANEKLNGSLICRFDGAKGFCEILSKHPSLSTRIRLLKELESK